MGWITMSDGTVLDPVSGQIKYDTAPKTQTIKVTNSLQTYYAKRLAEFGIEGETYYDAMTNQQIFRVRDSVGKLVSIASGPRSDFEQSYQEYIDDMAIKLKYMTASTITTSNIYHNTYKNMLPSSYRTVDPEEEKRRAVAREKKLAAEKKAREKAEHEAKIRMLDELLWELDRLGQPVDVPAGTFILSKDVTENELRVMFGITYAEWVAQNSTKNWTKKRVDKEYERVRVEREKENDEFYEELIEEFWDDNDYEVDPKNWTITKPSTATKRKERVFEDEILDDDMMDYCCEM